MARGEKRKELFTASEVARFCQVDLKTIHNWSDRGEIRHFRTPGRHLRFRRTDVLDFLRKYGYPIPDVLQAGRPRVITVTSDRGASSGMEKTLSKQFEVTTSASPLDTLITVGARTPDVVVMDLDVDEVSALDVVAALKKNDATRNVRTVIYAHDGNSLRKKVLDAGASAFVEKGDTGKLRETLESLLGLDR